MLRKDLAGIPPYVPGKRNPTALKLSSNEVAFGPLPAATAAMEKACATVNRYPDMGATDLIQALSEELHLPTSHIAVGVGSSALCQQLIDATCTTDSEVLFPWPSFEGYPIFVQVNGAKPVPVALDENFRNDLDALAARITDHTRVVFVCNPNNPTGTTVTEEAFRAFMDRVPTDVIVALDEAYFEYHRTDSTPDATQLVQHYPNLIGLRTFSKAFGLAGLRVGYAFGNPEIISALNKVALPFAVNSIGQAAALASLQHIDQLKERTNEVVQQRQRLQEELSARGYTVVPSQSNFIWLPLEQPGDIEGLLQKLEQANVLVRVFREGVRITVTDNTEMDRLLAAIGK